MTENSLAIVNDHKKKKKKKMESLIDDIEPLILKKANSEFTVSKFQAFDKLHAL